MLRNGAQLRRPQGKERIVELMNQLAALAVSLVALWVVAIGFGVMFRGRQGATAVFMWPLRNGFQLTRWAVGGLFILLGNMIRGFGELIRGR